MIHAQIINSKSKYCCVKSYEGLGGNPDSKSLISMNGFGEEGVETRSKYRIGTTLSTVIDIRFTVK